MKELNDVIFKYHKSTQDELKEIKASQDFIGWQVQRSGWQGQRIIG
jgi:hypothetical protein